MATPIPTPTVAAAIAAAKAPATGLKIRPVSRADIPVLAQIIVDSFANFDLHILLFPGRDRYPSSMYAWAVRNLRTRLVTPGLVSLVAYSADDATQTPLGLAVYSVGGECALAREWAGKNTSLETRLEKGLMGWELWYARFTTRYLCDWDMYVGLRHVLEQSAAGRFTAGVLDLNVLCVTPAAQGMGVGKVLLRWGIELAKREGVPMCLDSSKVGEQFYLRNGAKIVDSVTLTNSQGKSVTLPVMVWDP